MAPPNSSTLVNVAVVGMNDCLEDVNEDVDVVEGTAELFLATGKC